MKPALFDSSKDHNSIRELEEKEVASVSGGGSPFFTDDGFTSAEWTWTTNGSVGYYDPEVVD